MSKTLKSIAVAAIISAAGTAAAKSGSKPEILLVHGAWEQSDVWQAVTPMLKKDGYPVKVVTLPGRPNSPLAPNKVSLDLYRDTVVKAIGKPKQPVVLVGHSFAGFTISAAAEAEPKRIKTLVYVAAYLPKDGQSLLDLGNSDKDSKIGPHLQIMKDKGIAAIEYNARANVFCLDCNATFRSAVPNLIVDEPLVPLVTPIHLTEAHFGKVDKVYVHTAKDQVVSPSLQAAMVEATPVRKELTLQTGHTPFLTDPADLVKDIEAAAQ
ncbi:pimeloyl-ACP methyl ester carboxylesterase [Rhizobium sp. BK313]|uniref:alpha/beta fold hydrolase n=1 Tax=Rhizobium sp. BK313 TaxID=2587081 RepID=UPI00105B5E11|nr:alpha/beta fold hydrolase [Rhizobium sp. BK313]MBB3452499.1 pimeloyl-ACP methyl ester carboxylesterase [Rhizobium sp. BK313]